ncbi:MAG TPA: phage holin family protein [Anaerolineales bacterium]|nr:phage holin family protein [Anaerolineales bacterium]
MKLILRILINAVALWLTSMLFSSLQFDGNVWGLIVAAIIFGLVNAFIRPLITLLTLPITIITLGLFTLVINMFMLLITVWISNALSMTGSVLQNLLTAFMAAIVITIISAVLSWFLPD